MARICTSRFCGCSFRPTHPASLSLNQLVVLSALETRDRSTTANNTQRTLSLTHTHTTIKSNLCNFMWLNDWKSQINWTATEANTHRLRTNGTSNRNQQRRDIGKRNEKKQYRINLPKLITILFCVCIWWCWSSCCAAARSPHLTLFLPPTSGWAALNCRQHSAALIPSYRAATMGPTTMFDKLIGKKCFIIFRTGTAALASRCMCVRL